MSPAAANFQYQERNAKASGCISNCQGDIPHETTDSGTLNGFNCSKFESGFSSRSRRKHKKVKKQVFGSSRINVTFSSSVPVNIDTGSTTDDSLASFVYDANSSSAVNTSNSGSELKSNSGQTSDDVGFADFVFRGSRNSSLTNLDLRKSQETNGNVEKMGANLIKNFSDKGKLEAREASKKSANECGKCDNVSHVFGANKSDGLPNLKAENGVFGGAGCESGYTNLGFVFGASRSDMVLNSKKENGVLGVSASESGFGNLGCEFVALNPKLRESGGSVGRMGLDESKKLSNLEFSFAFDMFKSSSSLNPNTSVPCEGVETFTVEKAEAEDAGRFESRKFCNLNFMFSAKDSKEEGTLRNEEAEVSVREAANARGTENLNTDAGFAFTEQSNSSDGWNRKYTQNSVKFEEAPFVFGANMHDSTPSVSEKKNARTRLENMDFIEGKKGVDSEPNFQGGKVTGVFQFESGSNESSSLSGSRKLSDGMGSFNINSELDINSSSNLKNKFSFVCESKFNSGSDFDHRHAYKISDEMRALNIHEYGKVNAADSTKTFNRNPGAKTSNIYVFGSDKNTASSIGSSLATSCDEFKGMNHSGLGNGCAVQKTVGVENVYVFGNSGNSDEVKKTEDSLGYNKNSGGWAGVEVRNDELKSSGNQPIGLNEKSSVGGQIPEYQYKTDNELNNNSFPSSSPPTGPSFLPKVSVSEAPPVDCSFISTPVGMGASFTGFSTPNFNTIHPFTANVPVLPDLNKIMKFSFNGSIGDKRFKKTRGKSKLKNLAHQRASRTSLSKESELQQNQESLGCCSPMDFSPYQDTNCEPPPTVSNKEKGESSDVKSQVSAPSTFTNSMEGEFTFCSTSFGQGEVSPMKHKQWKKYKMKIAGGRDSTTTSRRVSVLNGQGTEGNTSNADGKHSRPECPEAAGTLETCQKWRIRGNQAYKDGDVLKAETCYTKGIESIPQIKTSGPCIESLVLCYSNRAATRISLGRVREALEDCRMAASLDTTFIKVHLRAANCHLLLGEIEDALCNYNKCLETGSMVCLDRRFTIEAADGLQKAQKVIYCTNQSAELLQQRTFGSAGEALGVLAEALVISRYSEKLLEMKAEALFLLRKYEEVVQLCEQTLDFAEKNFTALGVANAKTNVDGIDSCNSLKLWRWDLLSRSYFRLGRLDRALDAIKKQGKLIPAEHGSRSNESSSSLAVSVRELLHCKNAGNEAFQSGRHTEAIEHYTNAISRSVESRPFAAVCICNRAAAHQALGEIIDAIADCSLAIALDGSYSKALSRRATLHEMIRDYSEAANDLRRLISVLEKQSHEKSHQSGTPDRSTGCSVKDLRRAQRRLSATEAKAKKGTPLDHYLILGLKASDASSEVKKAYRKAALRHHPDKAGQFLMRSESEDDEKLWKDILETIHMDADRLFKMIAEANAVLSDSTKRSKYDLDEEMRREDQENSASSSYGRPSNSYSSPFESSNSRSQESWKTYGHSRSWHWKERRYPTDDNFHSRW